MDGKISVVAALRRLIALVEHLRAGNDPARLLSPLADLRTHLPGEHPALAAGSPRSAPTPNSGATAP